MISKCLLLFLISSKMRFCITFIRNAEDIYTHCFWKFRQTDGVKINRQSFQNAFNIIYFHLFFGGACPKSASWQLRLRLAFGAQIGTGAILDSLWKDPTGQTQQKVGNRNI